MVITGLMIESREETSPGPEEQSPASGSSTARATPPVRPPGGVESATHGVLKPPGKTISLSFSHPVSPSSNPSL